MNTPREEILLRKLDKWINPEVPQGNIIHMYACILFWKLASEWRYSAEY